MVANAVSGSHAISTPYDNDNVDGFDYPYLADIFYTLISEAVFTRIFAYYNFMNTDLLAACYEIAETYEAVDFSRLGGNPYLFDQPSRSHDIVCYALTSTTVTSSASTATTTSVSVEPPVVIPTETSVPTTTELDLLSSVSDSAAPAASFFERYQGMELKDYVPCPPAIHFNALAALPADDSSNITL